MMELPKKSVILKSNSSEYKTLEGYQIIYGTSETQFGKCLMGLKDDHICYVSFVEGIYTDLSELQNTFPKAVLIRNDNLIAQKVQQYFNSDEQPQLLLTGTAFQVKVWESLVNIPKGKTTCYEQVAKTIEHPKAVRAVANAVGKNKIAYFVPCHRVISKNGTLLNFKWGPERKLKMLRAEEFV